MWGNQYPNVPMGVVADDLAKVFHASFFRAPIRVELERVEMADELRCIMNERYPHVLYQLDVVPPARMFKAIGPIPIDRRPKGGDR